MPVAGIDLHATYLVVTIVSNEGSILQKPRRIRNSEADRLTELLEAHKPFEVVIEASGMWPWLFDRLDGPDTPVVLAHPKQLRAIAESNYKTDAVDAELLARMRLVDLIPEVFAKPPEQREQATLVRHRTRLVRTRTAALGRIHAELHSIGVTLPRGRLLTGTGRTWVHTEAWPLLRPQQRLLIQTHEQLIDQLSMMIKGLDKQVRRVGQRIPAVQLLETIPGIGPFRALLIATEVEPISRFRSPKHLVSYAGLAPRSTRSGQSVRYGPIPAGANRWLRGAFVQSVLRHYHTTPDSWLSLFYEDKKERLAGASHASPQRAGSPGPPTRCSAPVRSAAMPDPWTHSGVSSLALHVASTTFFQLTEPPAPRIGDHGTSTHLIRRNPHRCLRRPRRLTPDR